MRRVSWLALVGAVAGACAQTPPETQVVNDAAEALGGKSRIEAVNTLVLEGAGTNANLGQNMRPDSDLPLYEVTGFRRTIDFVNGRARQEQTRTPKFPTGSPQAQKQTFGLDGDVAFSVGANGQVNRQSATVAKDRRAEWILHYAIGIIRAALDPAAKVANHRKTAVMDVVDITTAKGETATLALDVTTHLPLTVTTMTYNGNLGDVAIETTFSDYRNVDGLKLPARLTSKIDSWPSADIRVAKNLVNTAGSDLAAPDAVKATAPPAPSASVTVEEVAKGIWLLGGQSHHSVLVEFSDHTELIEVPQNDTRTLAVIAKAREIRSDKPLTKAIVTHHHFDHSGGIRAAMAEGLTLVTHEMSKPLFADLAQRNHTIVQDALARNPRPVVIETVGAEAVVKDSMRTMEIYNVIGSPHGDTLLMVYFPKEKILVQSDLFTVGTAAAPFALNLNENIEKRKLRIDKHLPLHGTPATQADFVKLVQALKAQAATH